MGCGGSTNGSGQGTPIGGRRGSIFTRQPKVSIRIGTSVQVLDHKPRVIFVFVVLWNSQHYNIDMLTDPDAFRQAVSQLYHRGPGTKKGKILEDLATVFNFELINVEHVVFEELAHKLEKPDLNKTTPAIQQMLKNEPELLRLDSVLRMLMKRLSASNPDKVYVLDFLPNLKFLLSNTCFIKDCTNEMRVFEERFPISFVLHFVLPKDKVIKQVEVECAKHPTTQPQEASKGGQTDEMDTGRTKRRLLLYETSSKPFLDYFHKKDRVVTIDVTCGVQDIIWTRVCDFFTDLNFQPCKTPETVIIFGFDNKELEEIEINRYSLTVLKVEEMAYDANAPVDHLIETVCRYIDDCDPTRRVFAVDMSGTSFTRELEKKREAKMIAFHDTGEECTLTRYCNISLTGKDSIQLQGISTNENEVCLFTKRVSPDLCKWVAGVIKTHRDNYVVA